MILTEEEVKKIVKDKPSENVLVGVKRQNDHKVHIRGSGFKGVLERIIGYESVEQFKQKKLLTKPFTRPLFKKIMDAQSRWKTARGTQKYYKFTDNKKNLEDDFRDQILSQVWHGTDIDNFVKDFLSKALYEEFNGFVLVEKGKIETIDGTKYEIRGDIRRPIEDENEKLKPYFVFISAEDVHNYLINGNRVEWLAYFYGTREVNGKETKLYRVLDDEKDYIVERDDDDTKILDDDKFNTIEHGAERCPVSNITHINKDLSNFQVKTSPVDHIIELLDYYLHQFAEHLVTEILHAHPIYYQVGQECTWVKEGVKCDGGWIKGTSVDNPKVELNEECPNCKGTGHNMQKDAATVLILPATDVEGKPFSLNNVAGYVVPPKEALDYQKESIDWMGNMITDAALGVNNFKTTEGLEKTATGVIANLKPLEDIISGIIDIIESIETNLTDLAGKIFYGSDYIGSEIIRGRKVALRDENAILTEIQESKKAGANMSHIKALHEELIYSRFVKSEYDLARNTLLLELEPLIGYSVEEVMDMKGITDETLAIKVNFNDLINRFELENGDIVDFMPGAKTNAKVKKIKETIEGYLVPAEDQAEEEETEEEEPAEVN